MSRVERPGALRQTPKLESCRPAPTPSQRSVPRRTALSPAWLYRAGRVSRRAWRSYTALLCLHRQQLVKASAERRCTWGNFLSHYMR